MIISIKWKDTDDKTYKDVIYRKTSIIRYRTGWVFDGCNDIFHCIECAENKIDELLGGETRKPNPKRQLHGIHTIGKRMN